MFSSQLHESDRKVQLVAYFHKSLSFEKLSNQLHKSIGNVQLGCLFAQYFEISTNKQLVSQISWKCETGWLVEISVTKCATKVVRSAENLTRKCVSRQLKVLQQIQTNVRTSKSSMLFSFSVGSLLLKLLSQNKERNYCLS